MAGTEIYERLMAMFRQSTVLPKLPVTTLRFLNLPEEQEDGWDSGLEKLVMSDPALSASMMRIASSALYGSTPVTTIRAAMLRIGERSVRSLAQSLAIQQAGQHLARHPMFDPHRYSRHSLFVGMLASALHARSGVTVTSEEVLAIGIMHDLHLAVLARVAPDVYSRTVAHAADQGLTLDAAFEDLLQQPAWTLAIPMLETWEMPGIFAQMLFKMYAARYDDETHHDSALILANELAREADCAYEHWPVRSTPETLKVWAMPPRDELAAMVETTKKEVETFLEATQGVAA